MEKSFSVQVVKGGFILHTSTGFENDVEVVVTQNKLLKAIKSFIDGDAAGDAGGGDTVEPKTDNKEV